MDVIQFNEWEQKIIDWARTMLLTPRKRLVERFGRMRDGEPLSEAERMFRFPLVPVPLPLEFLARMVRSMQKASLGRAEGMLTLVLNADKSRILHAFSERLDDGLPVELIEWGERLDESRSAEAARMIREDRPDRARNLLSEFVHAQPETEDWKTDVLRVATLDTFNALRRAGWRARSRPLALVPWMLVAAIDIGVERTLRHDPPVNLDRMLLVSRRFRVFLSPLRLAGFLASRLPGRFGSVGSD